jgi:hypothetical protein
LNLNQIQSAKSAEEPNKNQRPESTKGQMTKKRPSGFITTTVAEIHMGIDNKRNKSTSTLKAYSRSD